MAGPRNQRPQPLVNPTARTGLSMIPMAGQGSQAGVMNEPWARGLAGTAGFPLPPGLQQALFGGVQGAMGGRAQVPQMGVGGASPNIAGLLQALFSPQAMQPPQPITALQSAPRNLAQNFLAQPQGINRTMNFQANPMQALLQQMSGGFGVGGR